MYELPPRNELVRFRYQRYFEPQGNQVRIWGRCEVTGKNYEITVPTDEFFVYLQGDKNISEALKSVRKEDREFLLSGTSPEGWDILFHTKKVQRFL
ncbi:MAG: hypothetical protein KGJ11_00495 [Candidatus Omnitrophica bacterium]|nr:hypothetical protein [Candidatus Omnitrophota bacterium]